MRASEITSQPVEWLWHPYIPRGKLSVVAGQMGQAKSLLTMYLAAAVSTARGIGLSEPGGVVMLNAEDDAEDTIRPRAEAAGADLERIWIERQVTLDVEHLGLICDELGETALVTVDPIQAYLPGTVNSWKGQDVRLALEPLRRFASDRHLAVLLVQHLNRRTDAADPLARIADSQGIPQLARSVLLWGPDPSDPEGDQGSKKALTRAKGNLARSRASATFTVTETQVAGGISAPLLVRGDDREITAEEVVTDRETQSATEEAAEWLRILLASGPMSAKDVMKRARDDGIAERTLRRAKPKVGAISQQSREEGEIRGWEWSLPSPNGNGHVGSLDSVGHVGTPAKAANQAKMFTPLGETQ